MTKKIFLTSAITMCIACPAFAEMTDSNSFPNASNNEYMQENMRYIGAATDTNMAGVYADNATVYANAQYSDATYPLAAGQYLPANSETPTDCDQNGYFCAGDSNGVNYSSSAQGLTQCPSGYGNSGTGASANTDCYRTCVNNDITHATAITGNVYYNGTDGDGVKDCTPTTCENGWHPKAAVPDLTTVVGTGEGASRAYVNSSGNFSEDRASYGAAFYGLSTSDPMSFAVNYGNNGIIHGHARCSTQSGQDAWNWSTSQAQTPTTLSSLTDETGQEGAIYCYCQVDGYTPNGGTLQSLSSSWVIFASSSSASNCANDCASSCSATMRSAHSISLASRAALFGSVDASPASCVANTINITWQGASSEAINANEAGTVTYGGDIRTPQSAIHVPGKVFDGWEFSTTAPSND